LFNAHLVVQLNIRLHGVGRCVICLHRIPVEQQLRGIFALAGIAKLAALVAQRDVGRRVLADGLVEFTFSRMRGHRRILRNRLVVGGNIVLALGCQAICAGACIAQQQQRIRPADGGDRIANISQRPHGGHGVGHDIVDSGSDLEKASQRGRPQQGAQQADSAKGIAEFVRYAKVAKHGHFIQIPLPTEALRK
jgi:hypothetical protein